jgi:hypothetical protein
MKTAKFYVYDHTPTPDSCWSLSTGPDGRIYAASCCECTAGGGVYITRYNDKTDTVDTIVDVAGVTGESLKSGRATQCKIHYSFAPALESGIMYAATHLSAPGYGQLSYSPWADWKEDKYAFPFSTLVAYDTRKDSVAWTSQFIPREGCRCLALDEKRGKLYAIGYPRDHFWIYDIASRSIRSLGRLGSVNSQAIFTDRRGRVFTTNCSGQLVRYDPDTDKLEEIPAFVPHAPGMTGWHCVLYDVVPSPEGDCVYGVPWNSQPRLFRYWPEDGPYGRMEDLGALHQDRDPTMPVCFYLDHVGGLVFGADGKLYVCTSRWESGKESQDPHGSYKVDGIVVQYDTKTGKKVDFAKLERPDGCQGHYISRGARDRFGNLYFGNVTRPKAAGIYRVKMDAAGDNLHLPMRTWG